MLLERRGWCRCFAVGCGGGGAQANGYGLLGFLQEGFGDLAGLADDLTGLGLSAVFSVSEEVVGLALGDLDGAYACDSSTSTLVDCLGGLTVGVGGGVVGLLLSALSGMSPALWQASFRMVRACWLAS
ncbi:hypothetical protein E1287_40850 [Actinomadura sp. KC06]|uniref:hypothetical protein n=1 Tax=Actinomadura sp. KC06 TaxID=2530369 RepID=UPI001045B8AA|nr:hypothetical protein [Actinomadura sp. KC06]TDD21093.1 hypothetical protein E1287_40850 [Actinomadura sp. KC06]